MNDTSVDLTKYNSSFSLRNKIGRFLWFFVRLILIRPFVLNLFKPYRVLLLRMFGAKIGKGVNVYASAKIWAPWNLEIGDNSTIGPRVDCYNQGKITIGKQTVISQKTYLCSSTHDFEISNYPLVLRDIVIYDQVWIAADAFIGPGVSISEGVVVGARAAVFKDVESWTVVGGNPAKFIKKRIIKDEA